ncbi:hypothetical protein AB4Z46_31515 [Variovorax sp. M-6]|uniref:hypothetical protein n=1 Tax=Variovorax sp. M-6 TaxID=3233041 RepID=UPI003F9B20FC
MSTEALRTALRAARPTVKATQLRELLPDIEARLAEGVTFSGIQEALAGAGLVMTLQTLQTYVYRLRRERDESASKDVKDVDRGLLPPEAAPAVGDGVGVDPAHSPSLPEAGTNAKSVAIQAEQHNIPARQQAIGRTSPTADAPRGLEATSAPHDAGNMSDARAHIAAAPQRSHRSDADSDEQVLTALEGAKQVASNDFSRFARNLSRKTKQ